MIKTFGGTFSKSRSSLTWSKILRFLSLPFSPAKLKTYLVVEKFADIPIDKLIADGIKGVILDADGTMGANGATHFPDSAAQLVKRMRDQGLRLAIYTNAAENRFRQFPGVELVSDAPAKPDPRGFEIAMRRHLQLEDPSQVCMIGDNYVTDGGAIAAGMRFLYVKPVAGNESPLHRAARHFGYLCARLHSPESFAGRTFADTRECRHIR